jgi:hypothetical protein
MMRRSGPKAKALTRFWNFDFGTGFIPAKWRTEAQQQASAGHTQKRPWLAQKRAFITVGSPHISGTPASAGEPPLQNETIRPSWLPEMFLSTVADVEDINSFRGLVDSEEDSIRAVALTIEKLSDIHLELFCFWGAMATLGIFRE